MLSEAIAGQSLEEIDSTGELFRNMMAGPPLSGGSLERLGGLAALSDVRKVPVRIKCALLAWSALEDGIEDYRKGTRRLGQRGWNDANQTTRSRELQKP